MCLGSTSSDETRFAYVPSVPSDTAEGTIIQSATGQFYIVGSSTDVLNNPTNRQLVPRTIPDIRAGLGLGSCRDDRRRATHNEVERRRRDKINNWITKLAKIIPDCQHENTKTNQVSKTRFLFKNSF